MLDDLRNYTRSLSIAKRVVLILTVLFFITAGSSFSYAAYIFFLPARPETTPSASGAVSPVDFFGKANKERVEALLDQRTVASPLNGLLFTEEEAKAWQARRPMAVMINNHRDARPQWGLSSADIIYEAVAEGGISRFLAIFHSSSPEKVGPVRSARKYYVDWVKEYDAWYAHWGGASTANEANVYDYMRTIFVSSIDAMWAGSGPQSAFDRDMERANEVAWEHTGYARVPILYETAYKQYPDQAQALREFESWKFKEDLVEDKRPSTASVEFNFWDLPEFVVKWEYDAKTNTYVRFQGGKEQQDALTNEPLRAKNVIVVFMQETALLDEKAHLLYKTLGNGNAKVFRDGQVVEATWSRVELSRRTKFFDKKGAEVIFSRGQTWIEVLPIGNAITFN